MDGRKKLRPVRDEFFPGASLNVWSNDSLEVRAAEAGLEFGEAQE